jgi:hypothetical protein
MDAHYWVFGVKYFMKGIEYSRLVSNDKLDKALTIGLYALLVCFEVFLCGEYLVIYARMPVFKPPAGTTNLECTRLYAGYV